MRKATLAVAAAMALAAPSLGAQASVRADGPRFGWDPRRLFGGSKRISQRQRRDPSRLQLRGWPQIPCGAPYGYSWQQAAAGRRLWYLHATPPGAGRVIRDEANGRLIIFSGWGYVKPTYQPMEGA